MQWRLLHSSLDVIEETAETYVLGRLGEKDEESYEAHLLVCDQCRSAVELIDEFIEVFRDVAQRQQWRVPA